MTIPPRRSAESAADQRTSVPVSDGGRPAGPWRSRAEGLPALDSGQIVAAALTLTAEHGLSGWTMRQLAAAVDAAPNVVYHYVGNREAVRAAVVRRVIEMIPAPPNDLPWPDWARRQLDEIPAVLRRYPGVAVSDLGPILERLRHNLWAAGFGDESGAASWCLMSAACMPVPTTDNEADKWAVDECRDYAIKLSLDALMRRLEVLRRA